jgi:hypothetical protein
LKYVTFRSCDLLSEVLPTLLRSVPELISLELDTCQQLGTINKRAKKQSIFYVHMPNTSIDSLRLIHYSYSSVKLIFCKVSIGDECKNEDSFFKISPIENGSFLKEKVTKIAYNEAYESSRNNFIFYSVQLKSINGQISIGTSSVNKAVIKF